MYTELDIIFKTDLIEITFMDDLIPVCFYYEIDPGQEQTHDQEEILPEILNLRWLKEAYSDELNAQIEKGKEDIKKRILQVLI